MQCLTLHYCLKKIQIKYKTKQIRNVLFTVEEGRPQWGNENRATSRYTRLVPNPGQFNSDQSKLKFFKKNLDYTIFYILWSLLGSSDDTSHFMFT